MSACALPFRLRALSCLLQPWPANLPALRGQVAMLVEKSALPEEQVRRLQEEIQNLHRQVHRDSNNSGQSPSQDGPGRRRRSLHCGTGRRPGAVGPSGPHLPSGGSLQVDTHGPIH